MNEAKYLRVTVHDNDYTHSLEIACEFLYKMFSDSHFPTEEKIYNFEQSFRYLWAGVHFIDKTLWKDKVIDDPSYFVSNLFPYFEFVDYFDIPDDDNYESVYIPMFPNAEILVR